jgi:hypothetical protein
VGKWALEIEVLAISREIIRCLKNKMIALYSELFAEANGGVHIVKIKKE